MTMNLYQRNMCISITHVWSHWWRNIHLQVLTYNLQIQSTTHKFMNIILWSHILARQEMGVLLKVNDLQWSSFYNMALCTNSKLLWFVNVAANHTNNITFILETTAVLSPHPLPPHQPILQCWSTLNLSAVVVSLPTHGEKFKKKQSSKPLQKIPPNTGVFLRPSSASHTLYSLPVWW